MIAEAIDDLVTVHRWDQRGGGRSAVSGRYAVGRFVSDLEAIRAHFGYERWLVGGHSWGATLALRYAFAHPQRVSALLYLLGTAALLYLLGTGVGSAWRQAHHAEADRRLTPEQRRRRDWLRARERNGTEEHEFRRLNGAPDFADPDRAFALAAAQYATDRASVNYGWSAGRSTAPCSSSTGQKIPGPRGRSTAW